MVVNGVTVANPLYPGKFQTDPGAVPSVTACIRIDWNDGHDNLNPCADAINGGQWGYNNLQWYGTTYYHKFNNHWHISYEFYDLHENGVPNLKNPTVQALNALAPGDYGTPFGFPYITKNAPNEAQCSNAAVVRCNAFAIGSVAYINYSPNPLNNFSFRPEIYYDPQGQRTGTAATYSGTLAWLAALVFSAGRDTPGNRLLPLQRCERLQRWHQELHGFRCLGLDLAFLTMGRCPSLWSPRPADIN